MRRDDATMLLFILAGVAVIGRRRIEWGDGWMWPVPDALVGGTLYKAVISDGYGSPRPSGQTHRGVDVMYRRRSLSDAPQYANGTTDGSPWHFAPAGTPIVAARDGVVWSSKRTERGGSVVIDHGAPFATYYTHLDALALPTHERGKSVATGQPTRIRAGDVIGTMGFDPMDKSKLRHLHFAVWHGGNDTNAVDPAGAMRTWRRVPWLFTPRS